MKKILLFAALLPAILFAQIGPINYNDFEQLTPEDVRILRDVIKENYTSVTNALLGMTACDVILGDVK